MFVSNNMTRKLVTVTAATSLFDAQKLMAEHRIRHLPVIEGKDELIGIVTDRDIRSALPCELIRDTGDDAARRNAVSLRVADIMTPDPTTISPEDTIQDALLMIQDKRVGAFPVVDNFGRLKGIISVRDLLQAFINVLNIGQPGTLLCILVEEKVGQLKKIVDAITEENISIGSVLVAKAWQENMRAVFPYVLAMNVAPLKRKMERLGFTLINPMEWYLDQLPKHEPDE